MNFMTEQERFENQSSGNPYLPCPKCGTTDTKPFDNCGCPGPDHNPKHNMKWHHLCKADK